VLKAHKVRLVLKAPLKVRPEDKEFKVPKELLELQVYLKEQLEVKAFKELKELLGQMD